MKFSRTISIVLLCAMIAQLAVFVAADEIASEEMDMFIIHDCETNNKIEELLALRGELELDYATNQEQISQIDLQLHQLGMEDITAAEILNKMNIAVPAIDLPSSTDGIGWVSRRQVVTYYGQHYELQICEAIPNSLDSPLIDTQASCDYEAKGIVAGITNAMKIVAVDAAAGAIDKCSISDELKKGITVLEAIHSAQQIVGGFQEALSSSTVFDNVLATAHIDFSVHMRYIFVKPYQTPDEGNQALCYVGSGVTYDILTTTSIWELVNGEPQPTKIANGLQGTAYSQYYDDYSEATKKYHNYLYNGITSFICWYYMDSITFNFFGEDTTFYVPKEIRFA